MILCETVDESARTTNAPKKRRQMLLLGMQQFEMKMEFNRKARRRRSRLD